MPASIRHWTVAFASAVKTKVGVVSLVRAGGPLVIVTVGAVVSTVIERVAGVLSMFPASSTARTLNVCAPGASVAAVNGFGHAVAVAPSTEHR